MAYTRTSINIAANDERIRRPEVQIVKWTHGVRHIWTSEIGSTATNLSDLIATSNGTSAVDNEKKPLSTRTIVRIANCDTTDILYVSYQNATKDRTTTSTDFDYAIPAAGGSAEIPCGPEVDLNFLSAGSAGITAVTELG